MTSYSYYHRGANENRLASLGLSLLAMTVVIWSTSGLRTNDILGLAIRDPQFNSNILCKTFHGLTHAQYQLCLRYPDVTDTALQGMEEAMDECGYQFRGHRWNCSTMTRRGHSQFPIQLYSKGYKETAFAVAITAAGVATQISRACAMGRLPTCGCAPELSDVTGKWTWRGCERNLEFAEYFTKKFLSHVGEGSRDLHAHVIAHNNRVGRLVLRDNVAMHCKCHGMSGSCEVKTCWQSAPFFRRIGDVLKSKYDHASKVASSNRVRHRRGRFKSLKRRKRHIANTNLVYFDKSPNFCEPIPELQSPGTIGRICNASLDSPDNCEVLCCGRGYDVVRVRKRVRCECQFHWCCYVNCKSCIEYEWTSICK